MIRFTTDTITIQAAEGDQPSRIIDAVALPYNTFASVSTGQEVSFLQGSLKFDRMPRVYLHHDSTKVVGMVREFVDTPEAGLVSMQLASTQDATDALELAAMGAYGVSVGVTPVRSTIDAEGRMIVSEARWEEISLVSTPAFESSTITRVAASADTDPDTTETATEPVEETEVEATPAPAETVEAAATVIPTPLFAQPKREFRLPSAAEYISAFIRGGHEFAQLNANIQAAAPDVDTSTIPGILPLPIVQPIYNNFQGRRPLVDATGVRAMPTSGKVFIRPVVTVHNTVSTATELQTIQASAFEVDDVQITKTIQGGYVEISEASIDWSQPEVLSALLDDMGRVYADRTDLLACSELETGTTNSNNFSNAGITDPEVWVTWIYTAAADILTGSNGNLPSVLAVSPNLWKYLSSLVDGQGRPLFPTYGQMNAFGGVAANSENGLAFGLRVVVDRNLGATSMIIMDPTALENWEDMRGAVSVEQPSQLARQIAFRGYWASKVIDPSKSIKAAFV